jgi:micrococcal nuclease
MVTKKETLTPYCYGATIVKVYDGDTVTAVVDLGFKIKMTIRVRLAGINAPEVRGASREEGLKTRDYLRGLILNKKVMIKTQKDKKGKYGRYIGVLYINDKNINELLVENQLAEKKEY